jgi:hypothetical protein
MGLAGFDDIPLACFVRPALTTMRVRIVELGRSALEQMALTIERPQGARSLAQMFLPELVVRISCGAANATETTHRTQPTEATTETTTEATPEAIMTSHPMSGQEDHEDNQSAHEEEPR